MKIAYLTIDDAPSPVLQEKVDFLVLHKIPAVIFCCGEALEKNFDHAVYAIQKGFIIGNHAYDHPHFSDLTLNACYEQIERTDGIIDNVYKAAGKQRPAKFFRFPYGDKGGLTHNEVLLPYEGEGAVRKEAIQNFLKKSGYTQPAFDRITYNYYRNAHLLTDMDWYWTYDVIDWGIYVSPHLYGIDSLQKVLERMDEDVPEAGRGLNYPGSEDIILIHDMANSDHIFITIIEQLLNKGINFKMPVF